MLTGNSRLCSHHLSKNTDQHWWHDEWWSCLLCWEDLEEGTGLHRPPYTSCYVVIRSLLFSLCERNFTEILMTHTKRNKHETCSCAVNSSCCSRQSDSKPHHLDIRGGHDWVLLQPWHSAPFVKTPKKQSNSIKSLTCTQHLWLLILQFLNTKRHQSPKLQSVVSVYTKWEQAGEM